MKILILSCSTGEGHNSAANAVAEIFRKQGDEVELADVLSFGGKQKGKILTSTLNAISKNTPSVFGAIYKAGEWYSSTKVTSPIYFVNGSYAEKIKEHIIEHNYDAVICSHLYAMEALTHLEKRKEISIPFYGILTDYTCIPFLEETLMNGYFIPHTDLLDEVSSHGINRNLLYPTGIPVNEKFNLRYSKRDARNYLVIPQNKKIIMIMTGGIGCGNVQEICDELLQYINDDFLIYVLVGRNSDLGASVEQRYFGDKRIEVLTFTEKVNVYMNATDVLITKPGGISSTEAAVSGTPIVHAMAIPGCETKNAEFFANHGMSYNAKNAQEACKYTLDLIKNTELADMMIDKQRHTINPLAAEDIVEIIKNANK